MTDRRYRLGLVGIGKIARDQHLPAIAADPRFELVATASRHAGVDSVPAHADIAAMLAGEHALDAVSICTPPAGREAIAQAALDAGVAVMLEKPPSATLSGLARLVDRASAAGVPLFATWHSREAAGVAAARDWLAGRRLRAIRITWEEDIRRWHPGQEWILAAGGFGVFDPGINAFSIVTAIVPEPFLVESARIAIPEGRTAPIAAQLRLRAGDVPVDATFDFLQTGAQTWDIEIDTENTTLALRDGGRTLVVDGVRAPPAADEEYPRLYRRFAQLLDTGVSDVDPAPLRLVADAFLVAERTTGAVFEFDPAAGKS